MKIVLLISSLLFAMPSFSQDLAKLSLGSLSPHGIIGASFEKNMTINEDFTYAPLIGAGADMTGTLKTIGIRGFYNRNIDTSHWYNRCLFVFKDCEEFISVSTYVHHVDSSKVKVEKSNEELEYSSTSGWLSSVSVGLKNVIKKKWVYELEVSKRILLSGLDISQGKGKTDSSERQSLENFRTSLGLSVSVGYQW